MTSRTAFRGARLSLFALSSLFLSAVDSPGQVSFSLNGPANASLCSSATMTSRFENTGGTLAGLIITQRLPSSSFVYMPGNSVITLPDSSTLTGAAADAVLVNSTTLVWDLSSVATSSTVSHLLITEVFYDSTNAIPEEDHEWIELYNPTASPIGLTNWSIMDAVPGSADTLPTFVMAPGQFVIVAARTNAFFSHFPGYTGLVVEVADGTLGSGLNNYSDGITLRNAGAVAQDAMSYGGSSAAFSPPVALAPVNNSFVRSPVNEDSNTRNDWAANASPAPGSGTFQSGIQNGGVITIVSKYEISCSGIGGLFASTANYQQPPGGSSSSASASNFLDVLIGDLVITKSPNSTNAGVGDVVVWTIRVSNEGFGDIKDVKVTDNLAAGLIFQSFSVNPTNSFPYGSSVSWNSSVIPALTNIPPTNAVSIVVTALVTGCNFLYNQADATWGCKGLSVVTNQTCEDTIIEDETAGAAILFIDRRPSIGGDISVGGATLDPTSIVSVAYCTGAVLRLNVTNTASGPTAGTAFNVVFNPQLPTGYTVSPTNALGQVPVGNIAPGASTSVTITVQAGGACPIPTDVQALYFRAQSQDACSNVYLNPFLSAQTQLGGLPGATVQKSMPESVAGTASAIPVTILFTYSNFAGTAITIVDDYPTTTNLFATNATAGGIINPTNTTVRWVTNLTGSGVFTGQFDLAIRNPCSGPAFFPNVITASNYVDCKGCTRSVIGSGLSAYGGVQACPPTGGTNVLCGATNNATVDRSAIEICDSVTITHAFQSFSGGLPANWNGVTFTSDLAGTNGTYVGGSLLVTANGSNLTSFVSITQTSPVFVINLSGLTTSSVPSPSSVTSQLAISWGVRVTNAAQYVDQSSLFIGACGTVSDFATWDAGFGTMDVSLLPFLTAEACGVSPGRIDIFNLPGIVGTTNLLLPEYDVSVVLDLDLDSNGISFFSYVTNSTRFTNMINQGGTTNTGAEPVQSGNRLTWNIGDLATNGAGSILFNLHPACAIASNERARASIVYNNKCGDGLPPGQAAYSKTNVPPPLLTAIPISYINPEISFLQTTNISLVLAFANFGDGTAFNVRPELVLPTNIAFSSAAVTPSSVSGTNVVWTMQVTNALGDLVDGDADGFYDDLPPGGFFQFGATVSVNGCASDTIFLKMAQGCDGSFCSVSEFDTSTYNAFAGGMVTRSTFPDGGELCGTNVVEFGVRNSGLIDNSIVTVSEILPTGLLYVAGSSRFAFGGVTNFTVDPLGDGSATNPLTWNNTIITNFIVLHPTETITIFFDVYADCDAVLGAGQFVSQGQYIDICGNVITERQVSSFLPVGEPLLDITKRGRNVDNGVQTNFSTATVVADIGDQVEYEITVSHNVLSEAPVQRMRMTDLLPPNIAYLGASVQPNATNAVGPSTQLVWSNDTLMALVGGAPYSISNSPNTFTIVVTGLVTSCTSGVQNAANIAYGCSDDCLSISNGSTLGILSDVSIDANSLLDLRLCSGDRYMYITNVGSSVGGMVVTSTAPFGYIFTSASVTGEWFSTNLIMTLSGSPVGSIAVINFTSTNTSGAVDLDDDLGDGPAALDIGYANGAVVAFELINSGADLDCRADPLDLDFLDPDVTNSVLRSSPSLFNMINKCGQPRFVSNSISDIAEIPDLDIDVQANSSLATNGQFINYTFTIRNRAEGGNAENIHARFRFGTAWTNLAITGSNIVSSGTTTMQSEIQGSTNVLLTFPGVILDPIDDVIVVTCRVQAVESVSGDLRVRGEVVGVCTEAGIVAPCVFTNSLGEPPMANSMTGSVISPVNGNYYSFDQDQSYVAGYDLTKTIRLDDEAAPGGSTRNARIGEDMIYRIESHYFGATFSNIIVTETLPTNLVIGAPYDAGSSGSITGWTWFASSNTFVLPSPITSDGVFRVEFPVTVSNMLANQNGLIITNVAVSIFQVLGVTNSTPTSTCTIVVLEPDLRIVKSVNSNNVQSGDTIIFSNVINHAAISSTTAYDLVYSDTLPQGLTFSGVDLGADGLDNDGDGTADGADAADEASLTSGNTITVTTNNNPNLGLFATNLTVTIRFPALVTNQLIGSTMVNTARVTYTSLDGVATNLNERDGSGGTNTLNDYVRTNTVNITAASIGAITKTFVSSSQTNTLDGVNTNVFTIGERVVYSIRVDVPQGIVNNLSITDAVPPGLDWVGVNTNAGLAYPGDGYQFTVPAGGPLFALTTNDGLVIVDNDPTPGSSLTADGVGSNVVFRFGAITNTPDAVATNDFFTLQLEFAIADVAVNDGILPGIHSTSNRAFVVDAFTTRGATGPVYSISEHDIRSFKTFSTTNLDAGDTIAVTLRVSNAGTERAYDITAADSFPTSLFQEATYTNLFVPDGWAVSNALSATALTHYVYSTGLTALAAGAVVTNVVQIQMAQTLTPNRAYTNRFAVLFSDTIQGAPPGGIPERQDSHVTNLAYRVPNVAMTKVLFSTSETNIPPDSLTTNVQIGEVVTYRIDITVPETTVTNLLLTDFIPASVAYITNSLRVDTNTFNGTLGVVAQSPTVAGLLTTNGAVLSIIFTNVSTIVGDNNVTNNTFQLYVDTIVNTNAINTGLGAAPTVHTNRARLSFGNTTVAAVTSALVRTQVIEPRVTLFKNIVQTNADAGDVVDIQLTMTNSGTATAYDLNLLDPLNSLYFDPTTITNTVGPTGFVFSVAGTNLFIVSDTNAPTGTNTLEVGESLVFTYQITMASTLPPNTTLTNIAQVTSDSLRSTNIYALQRTIVTGATDTIVANNFTLNKTLFATSETGPADSTSTNVQIGEVITFQLQTVLPEGTISNLTFTDFLPTNLAFVVGSVVVDTNSLNGTMAAVTNITPNTGALGSNGEDIVVAFLGNTFVVADNDSTTDVLRIRFDAVVLDTNGLSGLVPQSVMTNVATISYAGNPFGPATSGVVVVRVIEPSLAITKNIDLTSGDAGDSALITLVMTNSGLATAYDLSITDTVFGAYFDIASITNVTVPAGFTFAVTTNGSDAVVVYASDVLSGQPTNSIEIGEALAFQFSASVAQGVRPEQVLTNTAVIATADTIDGTPPTTQERKKAGAQAGDSMIVSNLLIAKVLLNTSETGPVDTTTTNVTIGEVATYRLTVTLPESTITNLTVADSIPVGMSYISNFVDVTGFGGSLPGAPTVTTTGTNGADVTITFNGNTVVSNDNVGANNNFIIDLSLLVLDVATNDGRPAAVDGDGLTILPNSATVAVNTNPPASTSAVVNVQVVEPALAIAKTMTGPTNGYVTATWTVTNRGPSTAYDVVIEDLFPTNWWNTSSITGVMPAGFVFTITGAPNNAIVNVASEATSGPATNSIEPGEVLLFTFQGTIIEDAPSPITNTVTVIRETTISGTTTNEREEPDVTNTALLSLPSVDIIKTYTSPTGRAAAVGETVTFTIVVTNKGAVGLNPVVITDTFDSVYLSFTSAVPPVSGSGAGTIFWTNVGPLGVGASTSLTVNFTALASTQPGLTTNTAILYPWTTNGLPLPPETSSAPAEVTTVGYTLTKVTTSPTNRAAQVGEAVSFLVTVVNTGEETLVTLPVSDTYETNYLTYGSAVPASVDNSDDGLVNWTNIGPLTAGASTTIVLNFTAINSSTGLFRTNTVTASPTTATNNPPVFPKTNTAPYSVVKSGYVLTKTITSPTNRAAQVGETVTFNVTINNTGDVQLVTVPVDDTYETAFLTYSSAVPASDDNTNDGVINWTNIGPLSAGSSTSIVLTFTAANSSTGAFRTNVVSTAPTTPTNTPPVDPQTSSAPYSVNSSGYLLTKSLASPLGRAAQVGEEITFNVTILNTGDVGLVTVPVTDLYETVYLTYTGATPASVDNVSDGVINWTDVGPLPVGSSTTLVLHFTAVNSSTSQPRTNVVFTTPTVPTNTPPVGPQTSSAPYEISKSGYVLTKTRLTPTNRSAQVGEEVVFQVSIVNTGDVTLVTVPVTDTYETAFLTYTGAAPVSDDNVNDGEVTWTNVGPLSAGASTSLVLHFTAVNSSTGALRTNVVQTAPTVPTNEPPVGPQTSSAPYSVSSAGYTLSKILFSPTNQSAQLGEAVVFHVTIVNTGDVQLVTVPVTDTYETGFLTYTGAAPVSDDNVDDGVVTWANVGPLPAGASTTLVLNFTALNSSTGLFRTNVVSTAPTTPTNEPPVFPKTNEAPYRIGQVGFLLVKTAVFPTNRAAQVGESVVFNVTVFNTGDIQLVTIPVTDLYETAYLTYTGAVPASDNNVNDGEITWTDIGPLAGGASTTIVLNFTAANSSTGAFRTNAVIAAPTVPTNTPPVPPQTSTAPYSVHSAGYTIAKSRTSPTNRAAQVGEAVTFSVTVVNTGDVQLVTVPVDDTYETNYLTYGSSVPPSDDNTNDGLINWTNIGPLNVGASTTIVLNFTAANSSTSQFRTNVVATSPTTPTNAPPVPRKTNDAPYSVSKSGYLLTKTTTFPTNRAAQVGEEVTFNVTIVNTGDVQLVTVPVTDLYETVYLTYTGATPASVDNANDGVVNWTNVGPLSVGSSTTLVLHFTAINSSTGQPRTNVVFTTPTVPTNEPPVGPQTSSAPYIISKAGYVLTKTLEGPTNRAAQVGETVTFNVTIQNTGDVTLVTVPVTDTYETVFLTYTGSVPVSDDNVNDGVITWTNVGPLSAGATTTLVLNFTAIQSSTSSFRTNVVTTSPLTPTNEPPVPPQTSSAPYEISRSGYLMTKSLAAPLGRAAQVGEEITFNVTIVNTGDVQLVTVPVTDLYETVYLTYTGATPVSADNVNDGVINWTNVGPLSVGSSTTLVLHFTAVNSSTSQPRTNVVFTTPTVPTNEPPVGPQTSSAPYEISKAGYVLTKTRLAPTNRAAQLGEAVQFQLTVENTGDVQLVAVQLVDTYNTNVLSYGSAVPPESGEFSGTITWVNIGSVDPGATTSVVVNFTAINSTTGALLTNVVVSTVTVPTNEPPLAPQTSSAPYSVVRAGYVLTKDITSPTNRAAQVGEAVTFNVTIRNTGDVQLVTVPVADAYETGFLTYNSAVPASDDNVNDGLINWTNIGPLNAGATTTIVLNFTAANSSTGAFRTNLVSTAPTTPTNTPPVAPQTSSAPYYVNSSGYLLTKSRFSPTGRAAQVGEEIVFNVTIQNTGDVALVTVPVTDLYETVYLTYTGASPASVDNVNDGVINWANVGPVPVGASTTLVLNFTAAISSTNQLRTNWVFTTPTVATNVPPVGPQTSTAPYSVSLSGYQLVKYIKQPTNRAAQVGEPVSFYLIVINTGDVELVSVAVTDVYETAFLTYTGSFPASVDNFDDGHITWTNIGPIPVAGYSAIEANFIAANSSTGAFRTNVVSTWPTVGTNEPPVPPAETNELYAISRSGYSLIKTLLSPTNRSAIIGEPITFDITIVNTGDVQLVTVPVTDTYDTVYLAISNAFPAPDDLVNDGQLTWANIGPLNVGASTSITVTFRAVADTAGANQTNRAATWPTVPTNEPPVPPSTSTVPYIIDAPAAIGNFVWDDANGDGIQDGGEPGVTGVVVVLFSTNGTALATNVTDGAGIYGFTNLVPGGYYVQFTPPTGYQFTLRDQGGDDTADSDADVVSGLTVTTLLVSGETDLTWDAGIYRPLTIGNFVWHDLNADGIQDGGETGLVDAVVTLLDINDVAVGSTTTDVNGLYLFTNIPPGTYSLAFSPPPGSYFVSPQNQGGSDFADSDPSTLFGQTAQTNLVSGQTNLSFDAGFYQTASIGDFVWLDINGDGIQDGGENGMTNVTVNLLDGTGAFLASTNTDTTGYYVFTNLLPENYMVEFIAPAGFVFSPRDQTIDTADSDASTTNGRTIVTALASQENDMTWDAGLFVPGTWAGTVYNDQNDNGSQQITEISFPNVQVQLFFVSGTGDVLFASTLTDFNGDYLFTGLPPGPYYANVVDATVPAGFTLASNFTDPSVTNVVPSGGQIVDVDFGYLHPTNSSVAVVGDYVWSDANGDGIQDGSEIGIGNAQVSLIGAGTDNIFGTADDVTNAVTNTTAAGYYIFTNVAPGTYIVRVTEGAGTPVAGLTHVDGPQSFPGVTTPFAVLAGDVLLDKDFGYVGLNGQIGNQVFLDLDGDGVFDTNEVGIANVTISLLGTNNAVLATTTTDGNGQYLFTGLAGGTYQVDVTDIGNVLAGLAHTTGAPNTDDNSQADPFTVVLPVGGSILYADFGYAPPPGSIGNLVFSDINTNGVFDPGFDSPIAGVTVLLYDATGTNVVGTDVTDVNGLYLFTGLDAGNYFVDAVEASLPPGFVTGPLGTGGVDNNSQSQPYAINLPPGGANLTADFGYVLNGSVTIGDTVYFDWNSNGVFEATDSPIAGIDLKIYLDVNSDGLFDGGDILIGTDTTDTNGNYLFTGLIPTNYIVVLEDPLNLLLGTIQTQGTIPQAVDVTDGSDDLTVDFGFYPTARVGTLGDIVWIDLDMDGQSDEDLSVYGINYAIVNLYTVNGGVTNFYATLTTTNGPGGVRGYYQFQSLPYGLYYVEITLTTVPANLNVPTTPLSYTREIGPPKSHQDADFGFILANPTAVELTYFKGEPRDGLVALTWGTAWEQNTLGFNLYRAGSIDGERTLLNSEPVPGQGAESGFDYQYNDASVQDGASYYYWLEEVETDGDATLYGPVSVRTGALAEGEVGSFKSAAAEGVYRISYETLLEAGVPVSQIAPSRFHVTVDGEEVAAMVTAYGGNMKVGDFILFYVPAGSGERRVSVAVGAEDALRMDWLYVEPVDGAGETVTKAAVEGMTVFETSPTVVRYLLTSFEVPPVWIFDVTDGHRPKFLFGAADLQVQGGLGVYLSYFTERPARCIAIDDAVVVDVTGLDAP